MGKSTLEVLQGVDLELVEGKILAIIGESGAGKSTLLHILGMLDRPTTGTLSLNGEDLIKKTDEELAVYRNRFVSFIFQFHHLLPEFNALENVAMPAIISGKTLSQSREKAAFLLEKVGLSERITHRPNELSGGELQRVSVARALMNDPSIIFADEPSGNLDHRNSEMLHDLIWDLAREHNCTFVVVTHDIALAKRADSIMKLHYGVLEVIDSEKIDDRL
ncbi:MAG: ABC transporter ATP-binding protein [Candidatus Latescibacteria bacterium]|nr:ABC transporter ATP-binding protein [Candidatus Latescibacterota bacterium]